MLALFDTFGDSHGLLNLWKAMNDMFETGEIELTGDHITNKRIKRT